MLSDMESNEPDDRATAAAELATLRANRDALAQRVATAPWWYDVLLLSLRGMVVLFRRITGFWVDGLRKGPTRKAVAGWVVAVMAVLGAGSAADGLLGWTAAMPVAGAVLAVGLFFVNRWWVRIYVAELRAEP